MKRHLLAVAVAAVCLSIPVSARIKVVGNRSANPDSIEKALCEIAPTEFPENGSPNFVLAGKDNKFYLGFGGMVKATASFDWGTPIDNSYAFTTSEIETDPRPGNGARWLFGARSSALYANFVAFPNDKNQVGAYLNFNFHNDNYAPQLQYAYLRWRGVTAGYTYSLFTDMGASAPSIDYQGPNSFTGVQLATVNLTQRFGPGRRMRAAIGFSQSQTSVTDGNGAEQVAQRVPDIPAYVQMEFGSDAHLRLSGIVRNLYYRNLVTNRNVDRIGWGVKLSGSGTIAGSLSGYFQALIGAGISSYYQDLTDGGMDMCYGGDGELHPLRSWGAYGGLQYDFTDRLHLSGAYSHIRLYPGEGETLPDCAAAYTYAQYAVGTLLYDMNDFISCGVEYVWGRRVQPDGSQRHNNRIQTCLQLNF